MPAGRFPPGSYPPDSRVLGGTQATQQQYRAVPAAPIRRQGGAPPPPGAPDYVPPVDDYARAKALFEQLLGPQIDALNSLYSGRAKSGMDAIGGFTKQLAAALAPLAGQMQGIYGGAEQSQASSDAALRQALVGGGQGLADALSAKLGAINAPGAQISDVAGGQAQTGVGAGNAGFALGSAELGRLIGTGTAEQTFAAKQPGIAGFTGLQKAGELQQSLQSELAGKVADLQSKQGDFVQADVQGRQSARAAAASQQERLREFNLNYNQRADIANQRAGLAKDKFKPQVGSDGSITAVYADGRVVKIAGPGTVPQAQRTGTWSTRITRDGSIVQSNGQTGAVRTVAGPNKAWATGTGKTPGFKPPTLAQLNNANVFLDSHNKGFYASQADPTKPLTSAQITAAAKYAGQTVSQFLADSKGMAAAGIGWNQVGPHEDNHIQDLYLSLVRDYGISARQAFNMVAKRFPAWGAAKKPTYFPKGTANPSQAGGAGFNTASKVITTAKQFLGTAYKFGGASPQSGFDCSGLLSYAFGQQGIRLPHNAAQQFHMGKTVASGQLKAGDAVFFVTDGTPQNPGHVAIYLGGGKILVSPHTGDVVKITDLASIGGYVGARRYT